MKKCLYCEKDFQEKRDVAKFCSTSHRVMWNRRNSSGKNKSLSTVVSELQKKVDSILDDRNNAFTNAARGRDEIGINKDELRGVKSKNTKVPLTYSATQQKEAKVKVIGDMTLESIKQSCPKNLSGLDKSIWIEEQKAILGIK